MAAYRTLDDLEVAGRRVLVRCDLNVPMQDGRATDLTRIERSAPTLLELAGKGARVVVLSHFGRPKGKVVPEMSLRPVAAALAEVLGREVAFATLDDAERDAVPAADGGIALLENLRFEPGEEANDAAFAARLAALGELYVNDAFSCAHRAHASTEALARLLPAAAGRAMQAELQALDQALTAPQPPIAALVGGAKVSTKLKVLGHLIDKVDQLVIGGGMANTFLCAQGHDVGRSLCERDMLDTARDILRAAADGRCQIVLPDDVVVARALQADADTATLPVAKVPSDMMILDVGPRTVLALSQRLATCRTLLWNGPLGAFEVAPFDAGTNAVARAAAALSREGRLITVAGGGDTVAALRVAEALDREVTLLTPRGAAGYGGPAYFLALFRRAARARPAARARWLLDCDDDPALAIFALQCGWPGVLLRGHQPARARLAAIAAGCNAELLSRCPASLDLGAAADPEAACRRALGDV